MSRHLLCSQFVSPRHSRPSPGSSLELLTQRNLQCNCSWVLITSPPAHTHTHTRSSFSVPSPAPASLMNIIMPPYPPPTHYSWAGISEVMCADTEEEKGGSVWVSESHNSGMLVCACVWVCQIEGAGEDRGDARWLMLLLVPLLKLLPPCSHLNLHQWDSAGAFCSWGRSRGSVCEWDAWKRCLLRSDWWEPALRCGGWPPVCVPLLLGGELDAWRFHDDYNGLQSVHFTEARGALQAAVWDCTGEQRHSRLWRR